MISLRFTRLAFAAIAFIGGLPPLLAQSTRVSNTVYGTSINSLTQQSHRNGAPTALNAIEATADGSVSLGASQTAPMADNATADGSQSSGGSAHRMAKASTSFSSMRSSASPSMASSSQRQHGGSLLSSAPAGVPLSHLPPRSNGLPPSGPSRTGLNRLSTQDGSGPLFTPDDADVASAPVLSASDTDGSASNGSDAFEVFANRSNELQERFEGFSLNPGMETMCGEGCALTTAGSSSAFASHGRVSRAPLERAFKKSYGAGLAPRSRSQRRRGLSLESDSRK